MAFKLTFLNIVSLIETKIKGIQKETQVLKTQRQTLRQALQETQKRQRFLRDKQPASLLSTALDRIKTLPHDLY